MNHEIIIADLFHSVHLASDISRDTDYAPRTGNNIEIKARQRHPKEGSQP